MMEKPEHDFRECWTKGLDRNKIPHWPLPCGCIGFVPPGKLDLYVVGEREVCSFGDPTHPIHKRLVRECCPQEVLTKLKCKFQNDTKKWLKRRGVRRYWFLPCGCVGFPCPCCGRDAAAVGTPSICTYGDPMDPRHKQLLAEFRPERS